MPTPSPLQIAVHIGAHKTATTHLQRSIQNIRPRLARHGVAFFGPSHLRGEGLALQDRFGFHDPDHNAVAALQEMTGGAHRLVLSEENFIGVLQSGKGHMAKPLYPGAAARLHALSSRIAPDGLDLFLSIRNPPDYLTSAYSQYLMGGGTTSLATFKRRNALNLIDWPAFIARLQTVPGVRRIIVWRYEDYVPLFDRIIAEMLGPDINVPPVDQVVHRGLSQDAYEAFKAGSDMTALALRAAHPVTPDNPPFSAYPRARTAMATMTYHRDVVRIEQMPGVTLLRP